MKSVEKPTTAKSGYWGVYPNGNRIMARVKDPISGKLKVLLSSNVNSPAVRKLCARAYDRKMFEWHGSYATTNFHATEYIADGNLKVKEAAIAKVNGSIVQGDYGDPIVLRAASRNKRRG